MYNVIMNNMKKSAILCEILIKTVICFHAIGSYHDFHKC